MSEPKRLSIKINAEVSEEAQQRRLAEVAERIEAGELDSYLAAIETAMALLDGDIRDTQQP